MRGGSRKNQLHGMQIDCITAVNAAAAVVEVLHHEISAFGFKVPRH